MVTKKKMAKKKAAKKRAGPAAIYAEIGQKKKKKVTKKSPAGKKIPKYHKSLKEWDRPAVMKVICNQLIQSSYGVAYICRNNDALPGVDTIFQWLVDAQANGDADGVSDMYENAKKMQADYMADELLEIADDGRNDWIEREMANGEVTGVVNTEHVQRSRLRLDARKWIAAKLKPRKYGDKLELSGDPERPLGSASDKELDAKLALLTRQLKELQGK